MGDREEHLDTARPFTRAQALKAGVTTKQLLGPSYRRLFRGSYVAASTPATPLQRVQGALILFRDDAWASHASAARVHDVPIPTIAAEHVSVPHQSRRRHHQGIATHVGDAAGVMVVHGLRVSGYCQMFVELAELIGLVDLVVAGDHLVRHRRVTPEQLVAYCKASRHKRAKTALRAARYVRRDVDSPMETRLRMLLLLAGMPEPHVNVEVRDVDGEVLRKYDLSYPAIKLAIEYDGRAHIEREENWEGDLARREESDGVGWRLLVVVSSGIYKSPGDTLTRVWTAARERGLEGLPGRPRDAWRAHFPGHGQPG